MEIYKEVAVYGWGLGLKEQGTHGVMLPCAPSPKIYHS